MYYVQICLDRRALLYVAAHSRTWDKVGKMEHAALLAERAAIQINIRQHFIANQDAEFFEMQQSSKGITPNPRSASKRQASSDQGKFLQQYKRFVEW